MKYRLILTDVDSTLIQNEVIDLLAGAAGVGGKVAAITERAMAGEIDFVAALRERVQLLAGLPVATIEEVAKSLSFSPGAEELIEFSKSNGILIGAVSGGFVEVLRAFNLTQRLDYLRANSLEVDEGRLTGRIIGEIVDRSAKAKALIEFSQANGVELAETVAIGDGANDLEMIKLAGLGVAFRGKPILSAAADLQIERSLAELLPYLQT